MKLKKIFAAVVASAMVISTMAITASAAITSTDSKIDAFDGADNSMITLWGGENDANLYVDFGPADVYGIKVYTDMGVVADDLAAGKWFGGGIGANSDTVGWKSIEWGSNSKDITPADDGSITWLSDKAIFGSTDKDTYQELWIQSWTGDIKITGIDILGKDGVVIFGDSIGSTKPEAAPAEEGNEEEPATTEEETVEPETTEEEIEDEIEDNASDEEETIEVEVEVEVDETPEADSDSVATETGNTTAMAIVSVMAIAGVAVIATKKRK